MPSVQGDSKCLPRGLQHSSKTLLISQETVTKEIQPFICSFQLNRLQHKLGKAACSLIFLGFPQQAQLCRRAKPCPKPRTWLQSLCISAREKIMSTLALELGQLLGRLINLQLPGLRALNAAVSLRCNKDKIWVKPLSS